MVPGISLPRIQSILDFLKEFIFFDRTKAAHFAYRKNGIDGYSDDDCCQSDCIFFLNEVGRKICGNTWAAAPDF